MKLETVTLMLNKELIDKLMKLDVNKPVTVSVLIPGRDDREYTRTTFGLVEGRCRIVENERDISIQL